MKASDPVEWPAFPQTGELPIGSVWVIHSRNLDVAVWDGREFVGIREKFGSRSLSSEWGRPLERLGTTKTKDLDPWQHCDGGPKCKHPRRFGEPRLGHAFENGPLRRSLDRFTRAYRKRNPESLWPVHRPFDYKDKT